MRYQVSADTAHECTFWKLSMYLSRAFGYFPWPGSDKGSTGDTLQRGVLGNQDEWHCAHGNGIQGDCLIKEKGSQIKDLKENHILISSILSVSKYDLLFIWIWKTERKTSQPTHYFIWKSVFEIRSSKMQHNPYYSCNIILGGLRCRPVARTLRLGVSVQAL